jgi:serine/threonine protein kinase
VADFIKKLTGYQVIREIAHSSIASIYEGYQESLSRKVLIKRLHPQLVGDPEIRARFEREARALAKIEHDNIVNIYDFKAEADLSLIVSEWISGGSVQEYLEQNGPLSEKTTISLAIEVLQGLVIAHEAGIIHRDIKPSNLLISSQGVTKITDFGLAQFEGDPNLTQQGIVMGTPAYVAPELISGIPSDARCDIFSLAVTLYELVSSVNPFRAENLSETLNRIVLVKADPLSGVDDDFNKLLASMMEKRLEARPETSKEVLESFKKLAVKLGVDTSLPTFSARLKGDLDNSNDQTISKDNTEKIKSFAIRPVKRSKPHGFFVGMAIFVMVTLTVMIFIISSRITLDTSGDSDSLLTSDNDSLAIIEPAVSDLDTTNEPQNSEPLDDNTGRGEPISGIDQELLAEDEQSETGTSELITDPIVVNRNNGFLRLRIHPWANVYNSGEYLFQTPHNETVEFPFGQLDLTLINPEFPPIDVQLEIVPDDTVYQQINLMDMVGVIEFIDAIPWAEVYLDDRMIGRTPIGKQQFLTFGEHEIRFSHPTLDDHTESFTIVPGSDPLRFRVDLTSE